MLFRPVGPTELVIEQRGHSAAKKQILLDLMLVLPRHHSLMSEDVAACQWIHG